MSIFSNNVRYTYWCLAFRLCIALHLFEYEFRDLSNSSISKCRSMFAATGQVTFSDSSICQALGFVLQKINYCSRRPSFQSMSSRILCCSLHLETECHFLWLECLFRKLCRFIILLEVFFFNFFSADWWLNQSNWKE